jgi:hypothetical protein
MDTFSSDVMEDRGSMYTCFSVVGVDSAKPELEDMCSTYTDLHLGVNSARPENKLECAHKYIIFLMTIQSII